jgi:hypothetical protein
MFSVNTLIQEAAEDLSQVGDGEPVSPELAASCEALLNRAIADLNADNYISLTVKSHDLCAAGDVFFRKLEEGEALPPNSVDQEPPDAIQGVSRQVGIRWFELRGCNREQMDTANTYSLPQLWCYGVETEAAPSGSTRRVGHLYLNGSAPTQLRIYENSALPEYRLGDTIYLSPLYRGLVLYALEQKMADKYKLYSYADRVDLNLTKAMKAIDTNTANNRPLVNGAGAPDYMTGYYNLIGGVGF